jgi:hypothetical protein
MARRSCCFAVLLCLPTFALLHGQEGRLQKVREEVRSPGTEKSDNREKTGSPSDDDEDGWGSIFGEVFGPAIGFAALAPFWGPHVLLGDDLHVDRFFLAHPYQAGYPGYYAPDPAGSAEWTHDWGGIVHPKWWAVRLSVENGNDFDGLNRFNGHLLLDTTCRFGLLAEWNWYHERMHCGCTDDTVIGDVNLTYRFAQNEWAALRAGLGFRVLADRHENDWGVNFHYGGEVFPVRPFVLTGSGDIGSLGDAFVVHGRATAGVVCHGWEIFAGYDFLRIGAVNLQGPMVGLRWWF